MPTTPCRPIFGRSPHSVNPAAVRRDKSVDDGAAGLQPGERAYLVARHQPAIAGNVGGKDRGEFALYRLDGHVWFLPGAVYRPARLLRDLSSVERQGEEPERPLSITAARCRHPQRMAGQGRLQRFSRGSANDRYRRNRAVATRPGEGPDSAPIRPIHGGASGNAPGSGTAELTKLEIRPDLDHDEIAGWRRRGHREAGARRGARFCPGRWALPHHRDTRSYMAPFRFHVE